ncbi:hypothetical protein JW906_08555 [bacterium]|nr:hypothetical protein [bacterium]
MDRSGSNPITGRTAFNPDGRASDPVKDLVDTRISGKTVRDDPEEWKRE